MLSVCVQRFWFVYIQCSCGCLEDSHDRAAPQVPLPPLPAEDFQAPGRQEHHPAPVQQHPLLTPTPEDTSSLMVIEIERRMWCATPEELGFPINKDDDKENASCAICLEDMHAGLTGNHYVGDIYNMYLYITCMYLFDMCVGGQCTLDAH